MDMSDRKFIEQTPFTDPNKAAEVVIEMIQRAGAPGHVWYHQATDRVRVCAPDYQGEDGEMFLGVYTRTATRSRIAGDIKAARVTSPTVKRTRSITTTHTDTIETLIPDPMAGREVEKRDPLVVIDVTPTPEAAPALAAPDPMPVVPPLPALPSPAKDDAYGAAVWAMVGERDKIDARIAELQLLRFLFDRKASDRLAFFLEDYCDFLDDACDYVDEAEEKELRQHQAEAREWAKRFALQMANDRSLFTRAAKHLRQLATIDEDCGAGDTSPTGNECRADAAECNEIASIFEFAAIKPDTQ